MKTILVTGGTGLIGHETIKKLVKEDYNVISISRSSINNDKLSEETAGTFDQDVDQRILDIRDDKLLNIINEVDGIIHTAAQSSHPRSIDIPMKDFDINVRPTLKILEQLRELDKDIPFLLTSSTKIYGNTPNYQSYEKINKRFEPIDPSIYHGFDEKLRIDQSKHTPFGVSKAAADLYTQEYAKTYDITTGIFRLGCISGGASRIDKSHNWETYVMKDAISKGKISIIGYQGYQVRDLLHAKDLARLFIQFLESPNKGEVYNVGGGRQNSVSILEAVNIIEDITGNSIECEYEEAREADHKWWITNNSKVKSHYPEWEIKFNLDSIFEEIFIEISDRL
jgi:CDP-paratose 2-epimerase